MVLCHIPRRDPRRAEKEGTPLWYDRRVLRYRCQHGERGKRRGRACQGDLRPRGPLAVGARSAYACKCSACPCSLKPVFRRNVTATSISQPTCVHALFRAPCDCDAGIRSSWPSSFNRGHGGVANLRTKPQLAARRRLTSNVPVLIVSPNRQRSLAQVSVGGFPEPPDPSS
jgi:hypothetical protein